MNTPQDNPRYDVFLSHHSSDKPQVEQLAVCLEDEAGLKPFLDKWHLTPGEPWQEELEAALDQSATCAVFLGPKGLGAWENEEMRAALDERVRNRSFRVIPVLLPGANPQDASTLPRFLRRLTWVDFRAGLNDQDAFQRLVSGIRGVAPGRQPTNTATQSADSVRRGLLAVLKSMLTGQGVSRAELWKILLPALLALLLSTAFIGAAIPRYKLRITSPAFRKEGIYEVPAGMVFIKWGLTQERWFQEKDISEVSADVTISKSGGDMGTHFENAPGEIRTNLLVGKYEIRIDAKAYQRNETIALQVTAQSGVPETATLTGTVIEKIGGHNRPLQGVKITLDELPAMLPVETSTDGIFVIHDIPKAYYESVRIRAAKEGFQPNPYTEDVVLGKTPPRIELTRRK